MMLLAITGGLALAMSAAGVYGVVSYTTSRRTQEIGIRMAVGATRGNVFSWIFRQGFASAALGLTIGFCAALPLLHALRGFVTGLESDPRVYIGIAAGLVALTAGVACWIPALRATRTDLISALRQE